MFPVDPFLHLNEAQRRQKLVALSGAYERLLAGELIVSIDDEGRKGVSYAKTDLGALARLIWMLQKSLGLLSAENNGGRGCAIRIGYGT